MDKFYKEWFEPYRPRDYEGMVEEFLEGARKRRRWANAIDGFLGLGTKQMADAADPVAPPNRMTLHGASEGLSASGLENSAEDQALKRRRSSGASSTTLVGQQHLQKAQGEILVREVDVESIQSVAA